MRQSGGLMLRSVARCLSRHRPSYGLTPSITCQTNPRLVPRKPDRLPPRYNGSNLMSSGEIDNSQGIERLQGIRQSDAILCASRQRRGFLSVGDGDEDSDLSRHHEESLVIGYSPEQLYAVVAAVDLYEDFLPWCQKSTVIWHKQDQALEAELQIGFKFFVERYISHVELKKPNLIKTTVSQSTLFDFLTNVWEFKPGPTPHSTNLHFLVEFQFRSPLYRKVANMFFNEVAQQLVGSFEGRCRTVYGPSLHEKQKQGHLHAKSHGYSPEQLYAVVAAVDLYEDFLPWCQKSTVIWHKQDQALEAELQIGFKFFVERYISHVELKKPNLIKTTVSQSTLFDFLTNVWEFKPGPTPHSTNLHFLVEFQFRSPLYRKVANMFFNEVAQQLVGSFEGRCRTVYGPSLHEKQKQGHLHAKSHG